MIEYDDFRVAVKYIILENFVEPAIETSLTSPSSCSHPFFKSPIPFGTGWVNRISAETRTGQGYCSIQPVRVFLLRLLAAHGHFWQTGIYKIAVQNKAHLLVSGSD